MATDQDVVVNIRSRGGRAAAADAEIAAAGITRIGRAAEIAGAGLRNFRANTQLGTNASYLLRHSLYTAGLAFTGLGALAIKSGLQFDQTMESNQIAFTQFLGSAQRARQELQFLFHTAATTPFETTQIDTAARQLLAFGFNARQTNGWLATIGDTIAGMGGGAQQIDQLVLALGQIHAKGQLQGQELLQLEQLGVLNPQKLAHDLGLTVAALHSGNANIPATKALAAIKKQFDATFGGQSAKQAKTFAGQISTLHDNLSQTLGAATYPGFTYLEKTVFPALNAASGDLSQIFNRKDLDLSEKITLSRAALHQKLGPIESEVGHAIGDLHIDRRLTQAFDAAAPVILSKGVYYGTHAAEGFADAWLHAGAWTKLASGAWLAHKLGLGSAGAKAIGKLLTGGGLSTVTGQLTARGATPANPLFVVDISSHGGSGWVKDAENAVKKGGILGAAARTALGIGKIAGPAGAFTLGSGLAGGPFGSSTSTAQDLPKGYHPEGLGGGSVMVPNGYHLDKFGVPTRNVTLAGGDPAGRFPGGAKAVLSRSGDVVLNFNATMPLTAEGGKLVAKAVKRVNADDAARNRQGG